MTEALGLIEVIGYPPAIEAADAALKAANVKLGAVTRVDGGIVTVQIIGDVGAVKAAVDAGSSAAEKIGIVRAAHVIPRLESSLTGFLTDPGKGMRNLGKKVADKSSQATTTRAQSVATMPESTIASEPEIEVKGTAPVVSDQIEAAPLPQVDMTEVSSEGAYIAKDVEEVNEVLEVVSGADTVSDMGPVESISIKEEVKPQINKEGVKKLTPLELEKLSNKELKNLITSLGIKVAAKKMKSAKKDELIHIIIQFYKEGEN